MNSTNDSGIFGLLILCLITKQHNECSTDYVYPLFVLGVVEHGLKGRLGEGIRIGQRATCSRSPFWVSGKPLWSIHCLSVDDQMADGTPNISQISSCHCQVKVAGAKIKTGLSDSIDSTTAAAAIDSVLPRPTSSAMTKRALW